VRVSSRNKWFRARVIHMSLMHVSSSLLKAGALHAPVCFCVQLSERCAHCPSITSPSPHALYAQRCDVTSLRVLPCLPLLACVLEQLLFGFHCACALASHAGDAALAHVAIEEWAPGAPHGRCDEGITSATMDTRP